MRLIAPKFLLLSIALILFSSFFLAGCSGSPTAQDIIIKAVNASSQMKAYKFELTMNLKANGLVPNKPGTMDIGMKGDGALDATNKQMQMTMNIDATIPGQGQQSMPMSYYWVGEYMYTKVSLPMLGDQWIKSKVDAGTLTWQDQSDLQLKMLQSAVEVTLLNTEDVNGVACYKMQVNPDMAEISNWFQSLGQTANLSQMNLGSLDLTKMVKQLSITEWIAKDSYFITKADIAMKIDMSSLSSATPVPGSSQMTMEISESIRFYDQNKAVTITLPAEAQKAKEMNLTGGR